MSSSQNKLLSLIIAGLLVVAILSIAKEVTEYTAAKALVETGSIGAEKTKKEIPCVVIDAGHGGSDPGKIGINNAQEKDINLRIALLVKQFLEANDVEVVLTRETDDGLYDADASNKKVQDMKRRVSIIDTEKPQVTVSIHQNSYPEEYVRGAQVFYYTTSTEGKRLAQLLQNSLIRRMDPQNTRQVKANDSYYLLKKTAGPIVIAECGFLSNYEEAEKLCDPLYQERVAWAIHMGVLQYLNEG